MSTPKTPEEIEQMIAKLEASKKEVPQFSFFGDNNWKRKDELIDVLRGRFDHVDEVFQLEDELEDAALCSLMFDWMDGEVDDEEFL